MRISIETVDRGTEIAERVAALIAPELGWSADDIVDEVQAWNDRVDAELANDALDDQPPIPSVRKAIDAAQARRGLETSVDGPSPGRTLATMSSLFGTLFRVSTFGESHGGGVGVVIDGCPPRLPIDLSEVQFDLDRRRPGQSRLVTQRDEADQAEICPVSSRATRPARRSQSSFATRTTTAAPYDHLRDVYRPSHADFTYDAKYGFRNWAGGGRASAREAIGQVLAAAIARKLLARVAELRCSVGSIRSLTSTPPSTDPPSTLRKLKPIRPAARPGRRRPDGRSDRAGPSRR